MTICVFTLRSVRGAVARSDRSRSDRIAKYNQLLRIADELGDDQVYSGKTPFSRR